ncbi:ATP-binding protein [Rhodococcus erythropolis]|uniref:ATP-binding protein n=1 Tax=Rhodococcus erythropolis TaxID=1833 RepID=UPI0037876442
MTFTHPFMQERAMGSVHRIDGSTTGITLPNAAGIVRSQFGQRVPRGEIGEFVVIDVGGFGVFGRLVEISTNPREIPKNGHELSGNDQLGTTGHIQLLATLHLDGRYERGIRRYPRIGDHAYSASDEVLSAIVAGVSGDGLSNRELMIDLGILSSGGSIPVQISASKLFGRHLAILGATGGGKSWTLAHIAEEVAAKNGKMIVIDATGEFSTLGSIAKHVSLGSKIDSPEESVLACMPHYTFSEADRNAFFRPSGASQLPKLRAAVKSLRLAEVLGVSTGLVNEDGIVVKTGKLRKEYIEPSILNVNIVENPYSKFSLRNLPVQISHECIYDHDRSNQNQFGSWANNEIGYCNTLISRIHDMIETPALMDVVERDDDIPEVMTLLEDWIKNGTQSIFRLSLRNLPFTHYLREIIVNSIGRRLLDLGRSGTFLESPLVVAIDEAHQFFGQTIGDELASSALDSFDSIAKEGRKYGLTVCMATQRPRDLPSGVLSQAGMLIVHRLADRRDRDHVEGAASDVDQSAAKLLPSLIPGEALMVGADFPVPLPVRITPPLRRPTSDGPSYSTGWTSVTVS